MVRPEGDAGQIGLTGGRLLARNTLINLAGLGAPMLVAVFAIPLLIRGLGTERFGVLTLMWVVIGYFSLLDLGLSRALTQLVAERLGWGREREVAPLVWTALTLVLGLGTIATVVCWVLAPWLILDVANLPAELEPETLRAMYLLALSLPAVASTAALRGVLEACQRFDLVNALRAPLSVFTYASPLLVLPFSSSLVPVIAILLVGRFGAWAAHLWLCLRTLPTLRRPRFRWDTVNELIRFGSWATVSNVISPLMVYLDRFLIGGILSVTAVAYYVTPFEVITKLLLVPMALLGVLFPAFASSFGSDMGRTVRLFWRGVRGLVLIMFPALLIVVTLAPEGLQLWLGTEFAENSTVVLRWLAIGVFINSLGQAAFAVLQGIGRPDLTGKLHVVELPFYLVGLWLLVDAYGIAGAAAAWVFRILIDTVALFVLADRFLLARGATLRAAAPLVGSTVAILCLATLLEGIFLKLVFLAVALAIFGLVGWKRILDSGERAVVRTTLSTKGGELPSAVS